MNTSMNIYLCGVGGQGIGLLSEVLIRACMSAGYTVYGCDTHGLAQRGGSVVSHLRLGESVSTPLVPKGQADVVVALERLEAHRGAINMLKEKGTLIYYDTTYQPVSVRMGDSSYPSAADVVKAVEQIGGKAISVKIDNLPDPRMQNVALLGRISASKLLPGVSEEFVVNALREFVPAAALEQNMKVYKDAATDAV